MSRSHPDLQPIPQWHDVDEATFRTRVVTQYQPAVLRGLVKGWPAVRQAVKAPAAICGYLAALDSGAEVDAILMRPEAKGRIFYNEDMSGFNFLRNKLPISKVIDQLLRYSQFPTHPAVAVQSALIADCLPGFIGENKLPILDGSIQPRIWLGNEVITPAHFDESDNIACVVSGRRRFTLFPPEQIANLYIGPLGHAPTGTPISLVSFKEPDFERFPRFRDALVAAQVAELEPGDALYIPSLWWHHVESLERYNVLVNYWWKDTVPVGGNAGSALGSLLHCLLDFKHLAPEHKRAWGAIFNHYIFDARIDPVGHIPAHRRGVLGAMTPELAEQIRAYVLSELRR